MTPTCPASHMHGAQGEPQSMQDAIRAKAKGLRNLHRKVSNTLACVARVGAPFTYRCDCMSACSATAACTWDTAGQGTCPHNHCKEDARDACSPSLKICRHEVQGKGLPDTL